MGYEPECRVLGLGVLPPRVPPSRPARQASSARDREKRLVKEDKNRKYVLKALTRPVSHLTYSGSLNQCVLLFV